MALTVASDRFPGSSMSSGALWASVDVVEVTELVLARRARNCLVPPSPSCSFVTFAVASSMFCIHWRVLIVKDSFSWACFCASERVCLRFSSKVLTFAAISICVSGSRVCGDPLVSSLFPPAAAMVGAGLFPASVSLSLASAVSQSEFCDF